MDWRTRVSTGSTKEVPMQITPPTPAPPERWKRFKERQKRRNQEQHSFRQQDQGDKPHKAPQGTRERGGELDTVA